MVVVVAVGMGALSKFWMKEYKEKEGSSDYCCGLVNQEDILMTFIRFLGSYVTIWFSFCSHSGFGRERGRGGERYGGGGGGGYGGGFDNRSGGVS